MQHKKKNLSAIVFFSITMLSSCGSKHERRSNVTPERDSVPPPADLVKIKDVQVVDSEKEDPDDEVKNKVIRVPHYVPEYAEFYLDGSECEDHIWFLDLDVIKTGKPIPKNISSDWGGYKLEFSSNVDHPRGKTLTTMLLGKSEQIKEKCKIAKEFFNTFVKTWESDKASDLEFYKLKNGDKFQYSLALSISDNEKFPLTQDFLDHKISFDKSEVKVENIRFVPYIYNIKEKSWVSSPEFPDSKPPLEGSIKCQTQFSKIVKWENPEPYTRTPPFSDYLIFIDEDKKTYQTVISYLDTSSEICFVEFTRVYIPDQKGRWLEVAFSGYLKRYPKENNPEQFYYELMVSKINFGDFIDLH